MVRETKRRQNLFGWGTRILFGGVKENCQDAKKVDGSKNLVGGVQRNWSGRPKNEVQNCQPGGHLGPNFLT